MFEYYASASCSWQRGIASEDEKFDCGVRKAVNQALIGRNEAHFNNTLCTIRSSFGVGKDSEQRPYFRKYQQCKFAALLSESDVAIQGGQTDV